MNVNIKYIDYGEVRTISNTPLDFFTDIDKGLLVLSPSKPTAFGSIPFIRLISIEAVDPKDNKVYIHHMQQGQDEIFDVKLPLVTHETLEGFFIQSFGREFSINGIISIKDKKQS